ncbi:MAG: type II secretion system F family protein [Parachlamydiaceae bacterium]|nr:type II secretion system F family protein [Parachlamydiaceae bacterium]
MPMFQYQALDRLGKSKKGFIEAHNEREARTLLRDQGVMVKTLSLQAKSSSKENLHGEKLVTFTMQLAQLVSAHVPLYESLVALEEQYRTDSCHRVILSLCEQIKAGTSLSDAMSQFPNSFDKLYRAMIAAGESVGALDVVLNRLSHLLTKQMKLKGQIKTAMIYPGILACFSLLIIAMLLGFVVPSIEGIFEDRPLNGFTSFVLAVSRFFRNYWWIYLPVIVGSITYIVIKLRSEAGKLWMQRNLLKIPIVKTLVIQTAVARFCRTMGTLQQGGLPIIESLHISRGVMGNVVLEEEIKQAESKIIEGSSLSAELKRSKWIPPLVSRMLAVGEDSGSSITMLNKLAEMYEDELEKSLDNVMALAQPVILIFMGAIIGTILMAILLPLTDISSMGL